MMTLDETIRHCEEKSCGNTECANEHRQLSEWLKELKELRFQKEQMKKDAVDATVTGIRYYREENEVDFTIMLDKGIVPYVLEEEVKVIIIKE